MVLISLSKTELCGNLFSGEPSKSHPSCLHAALVSSAWSDLTITEGWSYEGPRKERILPTTDGVSLLPRGKALSQPLCSSRMTWTTCSYARTEFLNNDKIRGDSLPKVSAPLPVNGSWRSFLTDFLYILERWHMGHVGFFGKWHIRCSSDWASIANLL